MNYKVGDVVRIKSREWIDAQEKTSPGYIHGPLGACYNMTPFMQECAGKQAKITGIEYGGYKLDIDGYNLYWEDWMFEDFKAGEPLSIVDAIIAMVRDGETLYAEHEDGVKIEYRFNKEESRFETSGGTCYHLSDLDGLRRLSEKRKRPMTRFEMLAWASSTKSLGWAVRHADVLWRPPQYYGYDMDADRYQRARLLPDLSGVDESTIQGFEVEE